MHASLEKSNINSGQEFIRKWKTFLSLPTYWNVFI